MFDLYLPPAFPAYLVKSRPEREEGAESEKGKDHQHDDDFRALRECRKPYPQSLVLSVRPLVQTFD